MARARESKRIPVGKRNKRSLHLLIDHLQGPVTCLPACGFQLSADVLRNNYPGS